MNTINTTEVKAAPAVNDPATTPFQPAPTAPVEPVQPSPTILGTEPAPVETPAPAATVEAPIQPVPVEPTAPVVQPTESKEVSQSVEPAPPTTYEKFNLPEGITFKDDRLGEFTKILGENKASQALGQQLVDFHIAEVKQATESIKTQMQNDLIKQRNDWKEAFVKDPNIGGDKLEATVNNARTFIRTHGGTPEQQQEFRSLMETSGLGNHPTMIRLLANAGKALTEGQPLTAIKPANTTKSRVATLYGAS